MGSNLLNGIILWLLVLVLGSGVYTLLPGSAYLVVALAVMLLVPVWLQRNGAWFLGSDIQWIVVGVLVYNLYFILSLAVWGNAENTRTYFLYVLSLGCFILVYGGAKWLHVASPGLASRLPGGITLCLMVIGGLAVLAAGQLFEIYGYLSREGANIADGVPGYLLRPGGYFNPNMTAAISLVLLFVAFRVNDARKEIFRGILLIVAAALTVVITALTQSRAAILALAVVFLYAVFRSFPRALVISFLVVVISLFFWDKVYVQGSDYLVEKITLRFQGDESSDERSFLLKKSVEEFSGAPFFGQGYRHMQNTYGQSSHNEVLEHLVNYGLTGFFVALFCFFCLYWPMRPLFFWMCVLPSLMFSHNFFETVSLQVVIGLALAIDRYAARRETRGSFYGAPFKNKAVLENDLLSRHI